MEDKTNQEKNVTLYTSTEMEDFIKKMEEDRYGVSKEEIIDHLQKIPDDYVIKIFEILQDYQYCQYLDKKLYDKYFLQIKQIVSDSKYDIIELWSIAEGETQKKYIKDVFEENKSEPYVLQKIWENTKPEVQREKSDFLVEVSMSNYYDLQNVFKATDSVAKSKELLNMIKNKRIMYGREIPAFQPMLCRESSSALFWEWTRQEIDFKKEHFDEIIFSEDIDDIFKTWVIERSEKEVFSKEYLDYIEELLKNVDEENRNPIVAFYKKFDEEEKKTKLLELVDIMLELEKKSDEFKPKKKKRDNFFSWKITAILKAIWGKETSKDIKEINLMDILKKIQGIEQTREMHDEWNGIRSNNKRMYTKVIWQGIPDEIQDKNIVEVIREFKENPEIIEEIWMSTKSKIQHSKLLSIFESLNDDEIEIKQALWRKMNPNVKLLDDELKQCLNTFLPELDEDAIEEKFKTYKLIEQYNEDLRETINLNMLSQEIIDEYGIEVVVRLSVYPEFQKILLQERKNPLKNKIIKEICKESEHKTIMLTAIGKSLMNYTELIENLTPEMLEDKEILDSIIRILMSSENNTYEIKTIDDIRNYDEKRKSFNREILEEKIEISDDPLAELEITNSKRNAILLLMYDINIERAKFLVERYGTKIDELEGLTEEENKLRQYIVNIKALLKMDRKSIEEFYMKFKEPIDTLEQLEYGSSYEIQEALIKMYERIYEASTYKINDEDRVPQKEIYKHKDGTISEIDSYEIRGDFNIFARSEGAYSNWKEPENFKNAINIPKVNYHGNCECLIAEDLLALPRPRGPLFGYFNCNGLLMAGPYDLSSNNANLSFDTANVSGYHSSKIMGPVQMKNETRWGHNEFSNERLIYDKETNILKKRMPNCVIWIDEFEYETDKEKQNAREKDKRWEMTKKAAAQLGVPIVIINRERCLRKEQIKLKNLTEQFIENDDNQKINKSEIIRQLILKFENNVTSIKYAHSDLKKKYFTDNDRKKLLEIIDLELQKIKRKNPNEYAECVSSLEEILLEEFEKNSGIGGVRFSEYIKILKKYENDMDNTQGSTDRVVDIKLKKDEISEIKKIISVVDKAGLYEMNKHHSMSHIVKVVMFSKVLAKNEGLSEDETKIALAAAAFHDSARSGNDGITEHAEGGAKIAGDYFANHPNNEFGIKNEEIGVMQVAIHYHEYRERYAGKLDEREIEHLARVYGVENYNFESLKRICANLKDADAEDRTRFFDRGTLDSRLLKTDTAKNGKIIKYAMELNQVVAEYILKESYGISEEEIHENDAIQMLKNQREEQDRKKRENELDIKYGRNPEYELIEEKDISVQELFNILGLDESQQQNDTNNLNKIEQLEEQDFS